MLKPNVECATCGKPLYRSSRQLANSKTNLFYCCKMHQRKWRIHKKTSYRKLAFDNLPHVCSECGYDRIMNILEVHHVNFDHDDNQFENLQILCPNCHRELHYMAKMDGDIDATYDPEVDDPDWDN